MKKRCLRFLTALALTTSVVTVLLSALTSTASWGVTPSQIQGSGSSWAENAVNQWVSDVARQGLAVDYSPDGDAAGRQEYANKTSDFAVTAEGYQGVDPSTGLADTSNGRPYAYLPVAAGGTAFPYQVRFDGQQLRTLRLSGLTLVKIFTNQITNWDDPAITKDNNGVQLPSLPIVPVVQAAGSGATQQLTNYFATQYPQIWQTFAGSAAATEYWPRQGDQIAENGSNQAMNYVASSQANGSISYVEYSFALSVNYPVAKILNSAGNFTLPTQYNVAVALEDAQINMDQNSPNYLLQNLTNVYTDPDPRTYPLSSYVYMVEPTGTSAQDSDITSGKRQALADFEYYSICQGQKEIGPIGYSPLPVNLVEAAFGQIQQLQAADSSIDLSNLNIQTCDNPTFVQGNPNENYLAQIAPLPPACDASGAGPCAAGVTPNGIGVTATVSGSYPGSSSGSSVTTTTGARAASGSGSAGTGSSALAKGTTTGPGGSASGNASSLGGPAAAATGIAGTASGNSTSSGESIFTPNLVSASLPVFGFSWAEALAAVAILLGVFIVPVALGLRRSRRKLKAT
jgi:ABC-type phosphate transport system substrate-binding protein